MRVDIKHFWKKKGREMERVTERNKERRERERAGERDEVNEIKTARYKTEDETERESKNE